MTKTKKAVALSMVLMILITIGFTLPKRLNLYAAEANYRSAYFSTIKASTPTNITIYFQTAAGINDDGDTIILDFDDHASLDFDLSDVNDATNEHYDVDFDLESSTQENCDEQDYADASIPLAASADAGNWSAVFDATTLTLTPDTGHDAVQIDANDCLRIKIGTHAATGSAGVDQIINPGAGTPQIEIKGVFGDTGTILVPILADDQVAITANVDETLTFALSDNAIFFGTLSSSAAKWAHGTDTAGATEATVAHTFTAATNAANGYIILVKGTTLTSTIDGNDTITAITTTAAASSAGTEQFGIRITESGAGDVSAPYEGTNYVYDANGTTADLIAESDGPAASNAYSVYYLANIAGDTDAAPYSTTLTYTASAIY